MRVTRVLIAALTALLAAVPLFAQEVGLDEIVVTGQRGYRASRAATATKTDTPIKDIPASIQVIPKKLMEDQGAKDLSDVVKSIGGATQSGSSNYGFFNNFLIRGLNGTFLRDGVPDGLTVNGYARSLTDVEQVEVLRGPGSALYGSGAPGGTLNLVSKQPTSRPSFGLSQTLGSFGEHKTEGFASGPLAGDRLAFRVDAAYDNTDGFRGLGQKTVEILPNLRWRPADGHTVTLDFDYRDIDKAADPYGTPFQGTVLLPVSRENRYYTPFGDTSQQVYRYAAGYAYKPGDLFELRVNAVFLDRQLQLLRNAGGAVAAGGITMTGRQLRGQNDRATEFVVQVEPVWKVKTGSSEHTVLAGVEYRYDRADAFRQTANLPNIANVFAPVVPETSLNGLAWTLNFDRRVTSPQYGVYAQDQIALTEQWKARFGGRFDRIGLSDLAKRTGFVNSRADDRYSWQGGLVYQPASFVSIYGGAARSHQSNFSTESSSLGPPERATQYELGAKTDAFDGALTADLAAYEVTRNDFLVTVNAVPIPVGKQRTRGAELTLTARPARGWNTAINAAVMQGRLIDLPSSPADQGHRPTGIPDYTAGVWTAYEIPDGRLKGLGAGVGVTARGSSFQDTANTKPIPGYAVGDLGIFYRLDRWEARLNALNVTDATYYAYSSNNGAFPGAPRTFRGTVSWRY